MPLKHGTANTKNKRPAVDKGTHRKSRVSPSELAGRYLDHFYRLAYYTGSRVLRLDRRLNHWLEEKLLHTKNAFLRYRAKTKSLLVRHSKNAVRELALPLVIFRSKLEEYKTRIETAEALGKGRGAEAAFGVFCEVFRLVLRTFGNVLNYVAPVAAIFLLFATVNNFTNLNFGLAVRYNNEVIGYIQDESVFDNAEKEVKKRIVFENTTPPLAPSPTAAVEDNSLSRSTRLLSHTAGVPAVAPQAEPQNVALSLVAVPQYNLSVIDPEQYTDVDTLTNRIIEASGNEIIEASGLYVEGSFQGATTEPDALLDVMSSMLDAYKTDAENEKINFVNKVELKDGLYLVNSLKDTPSMERLLHSDVSEEGHYTVVAGDNPSLIADKIGVPQAELRALNPDLIGSMYPGEDLLISRSVPRMKVQMTRRETHEEAIPYEVEKIDNATLLKGVEEIVTKGLDGTKAVTADVVYLDGIPISQTLVKEDVLEQPRTQVVKVGTNVPKPSKNNASAGGSSGGYIWPVAGGYISCPIWGYYGHTGTDIASSSGTPILAAMSGRVTYAAQTRWGYGKHIIIQHPNGSQTLYAHCSALYVSAGQYVNQGDIIAAMGRTGNASGNHCHFEIRQNGRYLDARRYIGYSSPY